MRSFLEHVLALPPSNRAELTENLGGKALGEYRRSWERWVGAGMVE